MEFALTIPATRPKMKRKELVDMTKSAHPDFNIPDLCIVGIRGYYRDTMGIKGENDIGIYDDAIFILSKKEAVPFNANTDPSKFVAGIATLKPGIWPVYKFDKHRGQYMALCQRAGVVTVSRFEKGDDTGSFGINIHRGGNWKTGSAGCQTIPPAQWSEFLSKMQQSAAELYGKSFRNQVYTYMLLENPEAVADQTP